MTMVTLLVPKLAEFAKALIRLDLDLEELAEARAAWLAAAAPADLNAIGSTLGRLATKLDLIVDTTNAEVERRGLRFIGDDETVFGSRD